LQAASATTASARELADATDACQAERDAHAALRDRWAAQQQAENDLRARCTELTFELRAAQEDLALSHMTQASQQSQVGHLAPGLLHVMHRMDTLASSTRPFACIVWLRLLQPWPGIQCRTCGYL